MARSLPYTSYEKNIFNFSFVLQPYFSQNNNLTISGFINDSESNTALEYATVSILDASSKNLINGVISENNGFF